MGGFTIPEQELSWRFSRSSGAGGQHVNTTDTRVELTWNLAQTTALTPEQKARASQALAPRLRNGVIVVVASRYRSQHRNRQSAREVLEKRVRAAIVEPTPRLPTRPSLSSRVRRRAREERHSDLKRQRQTDWT